MRLNLKVLALILVLTASVVVQHAIRDVDGHWVDTADGPWVPYIDTVIMPMAAGDTRTIVPFTGLNTYWVAEDWYPAGDCLDTGDVIAISVSDIVDTLSDSVVWDSAMAERWDDWVVDTVPESIRSDTAHYYAKVDTVLSCPECYQLLGGISTWRDTTECLITGDRCYRSEHVDRWWKHGNAWIRPDTTINTRWLPKIQVWLDPTRYDKLMERLK